MLNRSKLEKNLEVPKGPVDVILDTDTFNEVDDQYALSYLLLSKEKLRTVGICAAPFFNEKSISPADGMEKSYREIHHILDLLGRTDMASSVYRGATSYLPGETEPVLSEATEFMISEAKKHSPDHPLYILSIGAITNAASAILAAPDLMTENVVHVFLGGHALHWKNTAEFNMKQDIAAARIIFGSGAPLVQLPCYGVVSSFTTCEAELKKWIGNQNPLCDYLMGITVSDTEKRFPGMAWSRPIWDVTPVAWLLNEQDRFMESYLIPSPIPQYDFHYSFDPNRHPIRYVSNIRRDQLMTDLFRKLASCNQ